MHGRWDECALYSSLLATAKAGLQLTSMSKPIHVLDRYIGEIVGLIEDAFDRFNSIGVLSCLVDETIKREGGCVADITTCIDCMLKQDNIKA